MYCVLFVRRMWVLCVFCICLVCPSVKEGIPLCDVVSPEGGTLLDEMDVQEIAADIGKWWPKLTSIIGTDQSTVPELRENYSNSGFAPSAASRILSEWQKLRNNRLQVCELYDMLYSLLTFHLYHNGI